MLKVMRSHHDCELLPTEEQHQTELIKRLNGVAALEILREAIMQEMQLLDAFSQSDGKEQKASAQWFLSRMIPESIFF